MLLPEQEIFWRTLEGDQPSSLLEAEPAPEGAFDVETNDMSRLAWHAAILQEKESSSVVAALPGRTTERRRRHADDDSLNCRAKRRKGRSKDDDLSSDDSTDDDDNLPPHRQRFRLPARIGNKFQVDATALHEPTDTYQPTYAQRGGMAVWSPSRLTLEAQAWLQQKQPPQQPPRPHYHDVNVRMQALHKADYDLATAQTQYQEHIRRQQQQPATPTSQQLADASSRCVLEVLMDGSTDNNNISVDEYLWNNLSMQQQPSWPDFRVNHYPIHITMPNHCAQQDMDDAVSDHSKEKQLGTQPHPGDTSGPKNDGFDKIGVHRSHDNTVNWPSHDSQEVIEIDDDNDDHEQQQEKGNKDENNDNNSNNQQPNNDGQNVIEILDNSSCSSADDHGVGTSAVMGLDI